MVRYYSMRYLMGLRRVLGRCVRNASRTSAPLLFIQGARDEIIDPAGGEEIYSACPASDKTKWIVPESGHGAAVVAACCEDIRYLAGDAGEDTTAVKQTAHRRRQTAV